MPLTSVPRSRQGVQVLLRDERVRYLIAGSGVVGLYLGLFVTGTLVLPDVHYWYVFVVAQTVAFSTAFVVYRSWVFGSLGSFRRDLVRFAGVWSTNLVAGAVALPALVELAGLHPAVSQVIAVVALSVSSYLGHRFFSFGAKG